MPAMVMERRIIVLLMLVSSSAKDERVGTCGAVGLPLQAEVQPFSVAHSQQRIMIWFMPIFFTGIMLNYPAGLLLYIFTNNVLTVAQTYALKKWLQRAPPPTPEKRK